jgi:hypothetical protein
LALPPLHPVRRSSLPNFPFSVRNFIVLF